MNSLRKILILSANPFNTARLRLDQEVREIEEGLKRSRYRDNFIVSSKWAVNLRDLRRTMLDEEPHIVHFCGHGEKNGILVHDECGDAILVEPEAIAELFKLFKQVECVVLNACYSEKQAIAINKYVQTVIGMRQGITDKAGIEFAVGFYDALGAGKSIDNSFQFACNAIQLFNIPENLTPVLLKQRFHPNENNSGETENTSNLGKLLEIYDPFVEKLQISSRRLPVYFVIPQGASVNNSIQDIQAAFEIMMNTFLQEPRAVEAMHLSLISYANEAHRIIPLVPLSDFNLPPLGARGANNLGAGLRALGQAIRSDLSKRQDYKATVILLINDIPTNDWEQDIIAFKDMTIGLCRQIFIILLNPTVNYQRLRKISETIIPIFEFSPLHLANLFQWVSASVRSISTTPIQLPSISESVTNKFEDEEGQGILVHLSNGETIRVEAIPFAEGGQGALHWSLNKEKVAKFYHQKALSKEFIQKIQFLINLHKSVPYQEEIRLFALPDAIITSPKPGVLMPAAHHQRNLNDYINPRFWANSIQEHEKGSWADRLVIGRKLASAISYLENKGILYADLSPNNIMVNLPERLITIIDNDALFVPDISLPNVLGTNRYMAPEIVSNKKIEFNTVEATRFSLAILLYEFVLMRHPLLGPKIYESDSESEDNLYYGDGAVFIEDPYDQSNRPENLRFPMELIIPGELQNLFLRAFVEGLHHPSKRPSAKEWETNLQTIENRIIPCSNPKCPMKAFIPVRKSQKSCPWCGSKINHVEAINQVV